MESNEKRGEKKKKSTSPVKAAGASVMDILTIGIYVMAMLVLMTASLGSVQLLERKAQISQTARKYILRMEAVGYLTGEDRVMLERELAESGVTQLDLTGTTLNEVEYGSPIHLILQGKIQGESMTVGNNIWNAAMGGRTFTFTESKMSTAKN